MLVQKCTKCNTAVKKIATCSPEDRDRNCLTCCVGNTQIEILGHVLHRTGHQSVREELATNGALTFWSSLRNSQKVLSNFSGIHGTVCSKSALPRGNCMSDLTVSDVLSSASAVAGIDVLSKVGDAGRDDTAKSKMHGRHAQLLAQPCKRIVRRRSCTIVKRRRTTSLSKWLASGEGDRGCNLILRHPAKNT